MGKDIVLRNYTYNNNSQRKVSFETSQNLNNSVTYDVFTGMDALVFYLFCNHETFAFPEDIGLVFRSLNSLIIKTAKKASRYCHREAFSLCLLESALNVLQPPSPAVDNGVGVYFVEPAINVLDQRFLR